MPVLDLDDRAEALLRPVLALVQHGMGLLPDGPPVAVTVGPTGQAFWRLDGDTVVLSAWLEGPDLHHPGEGTLVPPLDRWRRAAASVLEGAAMLELSRRARRPPADDWRWVGAAIHAADRVAPDLQLAGPDLALAIASGSPGEHPRAGVAPMRAWESKGADPLEQARYLLTGGIVSGPEWVSLGKWVLSPAGAGAKLPVRVERVASSDVPLTLPAWSWRPLVVPGHPRGGELVIDGDGAVAQPWAPAGAEHRTLLGAAGSVVTVRPEPGGPVGHWEVASAEGFGQVMGARGISFEFRTDGTLQLVLADAAVGPLAAIAVAEQVGTSGVCNGRWAVAGRHLMTFDGIETQSLTMHGRRDRFMMPAKGFGLGEWLTALGDSPWGWQAIPQGRLVMRGRMMGGEVEVRLRRA